MYAIPAATHEEDDEGVARVFREALNRAHPAEAHEASHLAESKRVTFAQTAAPRLAAMKREENVDEELDPERQRRRNRRAFHAPTHMPVDPKDEERIERRVEEDCQKADPHDGFRILPTAQVRGKRFVRDRGARA